jgi:hypothetical protein
LSAFLLLHGKIERLRLLECRQQEEFDERLSQYEERRLPVLSAF